MGLTSEQAKNLLQLQLSEWELARVNYEALLAVESKEIFFDNFSVRVQFNPARMQSSAAKVDRKSIQERKCFLCPDNLPLVQKGLPFGTNYQVLVNPFPIFSEHFTIPTLRHTDQLILERFGDMLDLAEKLDVYTIFYNGPKCGASAPDHAHFQAGIKGFLPLERDIKTVSKEIIYKTADLSVYTLKNYLRNIFLIETADKQKSIDFFNKLYALLDLKENDKEPMMNILTWYDTGKWYTCVFPREKHRPNCFFTEREDNILISPGSVDLGGVFITPLEKDFKKITSENIKGILEEICISDKKMQNIVDKIKQ